MISAIPSNETKALIVDDEPLARDLLRQLLARHPDIAVVGEARDGREAIEGIREHRPQVVFLDIRMPELDGFEVLRALSENPEDSPLCHVIFVTAFDQYAVRAFEVEAVDYLLKPFDPQRLDQALDRLRRQQASQVSDTARSLQRVLERLEHLDPSSHRESYAERLFLKEGERTAVVPVIRIRRLEAQRKWVLIHTDGKTYRVRDSLKRLETEDLDPDQFVRVSRSHIVHLRYVVEIQPWFHGERVLILDDGAQVTTTRGFRGRIDRLSGT